MKTNIILNEDCVKGMRKLPENSVQIIVTSPPYNVNRNYKGYSDNLLWNVYYHFLRNVFSEAKRILKKQGLVFLNISNSAKNQYKAYDVVTVLRSLGFILIDTVIWRKTNPQPCSSQRLLTNAYEFIFVFAKTRDYYFNKNVIKIPCKNSDDLKCRSNLWKFPVVSKNQFTKINHCAMFPEELPKLCILLGSKPKDVVLDPFIGSGTTAVVAKKLGREFIGYEISKEYVKICENRLTGVKE